MTLHTGALGGNASSVEADEASVQVCILSAAQYCRLSAALCYTLDIVDWDWQVSLQNLIHG